MEAGRSFDLREIARISQWHVSFWVAGEPEDEESQQGHPEKFTAEFFPVGQNGSPTSGAVVICCMPAVPADIAIH
jgi:hypothetical protein